MCKSGAYSKTTGVTPRRSMRRLLVPSKEYETNHDELLQSELEKKEMQSSGHPAGVEVGAPICP